MNIINTRADIDSAPEPVRSQYLAMLAASIYSENEMGELITDTSTISRFGYGLDDFPDAPVAPWVAADAAPVQEPTPVTEWTRPAPAEIPAWRGQAVMAAHGHLPAVLAAIDNLPEDQRAVAQIAWNAAAPWARNGQTVGMIAATIGLSDTEIDDLFLEAMNIQI